MMQELLNHFFLIAAAQDERLYRCPKCNAPMMISNDPKDPWQYNEKTKKWEHNCGQIK